MEYVIGVIIIYLFIRWVITDGREFRIYKNNEKKKTASVERISFERYIVLKITTWVKSKLTK